jgi:hypothetical protein
VSLWRVQILWEGLVVFNPSFMEEDGHGILNGDCIDGCEGMFDGSHG